jgi:hypothetical protein
LADRKRLTIAGALRAIETLKNTQVIAELWSTDQEICLARFTEPLRAVSLTRSHEPGLGSNRRLVLTAESAAVTLPLRDAQSHRIDQGRHWQVVIQSPGYELVVGPPPASGSGLGSWRSVTDLEHA